MEQQDASPRSPRPGDVDSNAGLTNLLSPLAELRSTEDSLFIDPIVHRTHQLWMKSIMQNAVPTYCVFRNNRRPSLKRDERVIIVKSRRRVETGLLTAIAIRGRPVKGLSLADHTLPHVSPDSGDVEVRDSDPD